MDFQNQKYMYYHIKQGTRYNLHETREETDFLKQEQAYRKIKVLKSSVVDSE